MAESLAVQMLEKSPAASHRKPQAAIHDRYVATAKAAEMLGLSTTTVQKMVDQDELKGWKTRGGHRRISLASVQDYLNACRSNPALLPTPLATLHVIVVVESSELMAQLMTAHAHWNLPAEVYFFDSVSEAFLEVSRKPPHRLIIEMSMPRAQQEKTLQALHKFNSLGRSPLPVVLMTAEKDLLSTSVAGLNSSIHVVSGPLSPVWLCGYLTGVIAS